MRVVFGLVRRAVPLGGLLLSYLVVSVSGCDSAGSPTFVAGVPDAGGDSTTPPPPVDSGGVDSIPGPGVDSTPGPGPDSLVPPPDTTPPPKYPGIPFGFFRTPPGVWSAEYNGGTRELPPEHLLETLIAARRAGGKVILRFVGGEGRYRNGDGTFSITKWKQRLDRFRRIDFNSYIQDGTIAGHFILDEPHDKSNWGGTTVAPAVVDELARYSKEIWPTMATIVRGWPSFLKGYHYQYLDAAWAQYSSRFGPIDAFVKENVRDAKESGLALIAGLNLLNGGPKTSGIEGVDAGRFAMNAAQVRSWGDQLMSDPYVCAFISWRYYAPYLARDDIKSALSELSVKAKNHPERPCRHS
jgi:hypothetical protein